MKLSEIILIIIITFLVSMVYWSFYDYEVEYQEKYERSFLNERSK